MGWFPGNAIDVTTGERLNMAFGEDSWLGNHGGNDMMFNPSASESLGFGGFGDYIGGGKHFVYVFKFSPPSFFNNPFYRFLDSCFIDPKKRVNQPVVVFT